MPLPTLWSGRRGRPGGLAAGAASLALLAAAPAFAGDHHDQRDHRGHRLPRLSAAVPGPLVGSCESLAARLAGLPATTITTATTVAAGVLAVAGQPVGEHCRVTGRTAERVSPVDGKTYAVSWEMRLPKAWNGRFFHQGNGGIDGAVAVANAGFGGGPLTTPLLQGFAVLSSDAGHDNAVHGGPAFGLDPQARLDYGYQAVAKLTPVAKQAIAAAYGRGPDRSYFGGCSNGGRHTLVTAARLPHEYDGYLAGAPGYNLPLAALANIFGGQRYAQVVTTPAITSPADLETAFTRDERRVLANAVLARCDALDGAVDGLVQDTRTCQRVFDFQRDVPTCAGARDGTCLSQAQKTALAPIFSGATTRDGRPFYAPFPFDSGIAGGGIPFWEFTAPLVLDSGAVGAIFKVPPSTAALTNGPAFALGLDIDAALAELFATNGTYTESAMSFMTPPDARDMNAVRERGAKMIVYHGVSDPIFSVADTERWYRGIDRSSGRRAEDFARLYRVPGMGHCSGGPATDQADFLTPLVQWVERGVAPGSLVASARAANADLPAGWSPTRTRPLCPYPEVARYRGHGDVERAENWRCAGPLGRGHGGHDDD